MQCVDKYGRHVDYLRVSVTDRCNLRCVYCMPPQGVPWKPREAILSLEQIAAVVDAAAGMGFRRIRLTGGEPLVRKGIVELVEAIASTHGIEDVAMTTNAVLLGHFAEQLAAAGLARVNVSLDSLDADRFRRITRWGDLRLVRQGLAAATAAGLAPLKINVVVVRGLNDDELAAFARLTRDRPWHVRFIEVMPVGVGPDSGLDWGPGMPPEDERFVSAAEMRARLAHLGPLQAVAGPNGNGPARYFRLPGARGTLGFISPLSNHFCATCNRLRLTADGQLRPCLFSERVVCLKPALDAGATRSELQALIRLALQRKPLERPRLATIGVADAAMSAIGG